MEKYFQQFFTKQSVVEYWDSIYGQEDFSSYSYRQRMDIAISWLDALNLGKDAKIWDSGCGAGRFSNYAAEAGYNVFGMDYSLGMVSKADSICNNGNQPTVAFLQGDVETLPLKDSSVDVIVCLGVIAYLKSEDAALREMERVLKPGGVLILSILNKARLVKHLDLPLSLPIILKKITSMLTAFSKSSADIQSAPQIKTYFIPRIRKSLELTGFTALEYKTVPLELPTFFGKEIYPREIAINITSFFEQFSNIPFVESFGGICVFKAEKPLCKGK